MLERERKEREAMPLSPESAAKLTYEDFLQFPEDGKRHELIDGVHYVNAAPVPYHQLLSGRLFAELYLQIAKTRIGTVFAAPIDVELSRHDVVEPDLLVISAENSRIIGAQRIQGAPDLVVEILSPSTSSYDRRQKFDLYERARISEYWIVDPESSTIDQYWLDHERYAHVGRFGRSDQRLASKRFAAVVIDLREIW